MTNVQNLSEQLFKPKFDYPETSTLINRIDTPSGNVMTNALDGDPNSRWYRIITPVLWHWRGVPALEVEAILARICAAKRARSNEQWLDTVSGYQNGNWIYEFLNAAAMWQSKADSLKDHELSEQDRLALHHYYLISSEYCSIASYPHYKNDELALYAQTCAYRAYRSALEYSPYVTKELEFNVDKGTISAFLHLPDTSGRVCPVVLMCAGLGNLQIDFYRYFHEFLAPKGIALLTVDFPTVGNSRNCTLTQNSSQLYQSVLEQLSSVPWIDSNRVVLSGYRFGSHIATRLAYLMPHKIKGLVNFTPLVHQLFVDKDLQQSLPEMYKDMLASRLGLTSVSNQQLAAELNYFSLKNQGIISRACQVPVMSIVFEEDNLSTLAEAKLVNSIKQHKILTVPRSPLTQSLQKALQQSVDWISSVL